MLLREEALVAKDNRIIHLEDMDVKNRILERYDGITPQTIANSLTEDQF